MKAPKKIYVSIGPRQSLITRAGQTLKSDIEYIRKDALLEWLEELKAQSLELREAGYGDVFYGAQIAILEETIDKIESL